MPKPASEAPAATAGAVLARARARLAAAGIAEAALDARLLVGAALGRDAAALLADPERPASAAEAARADAFVAQRLSGRPVGRILGHRAFWTLELSLSRETLEPRPDTETVVAAVLARLESTGRRTAPLVLADLGTGTGAILLALLSECPAAVGVGTDVSADALFTARRNAAANGLSGRALFARGDFLAPVGPRVDVIVSNPPYIPTMDVGRLAPEVRDHDPRRALDGGPDGLACYRTILRQARDLAATAEHAPDLFLEVSPEIAGRLEPVAAETGWRAAEWERDLTGAVRCGRFALRK